MKYSTWILISLVRRLYQSVRIGQLGCGIFRNLEKYNFCKGIRNKCGRWHRADLVTSLHLAVLIALLSCGIVGQLI